MSSDNQLIVPTGPVYKDQDDKRRLESRNGVLQAALMLNIVQEWNQGDQITPGLLLKLQDRAITQIYNCAGHFRNGEVTLQGAEHQPPPHPMVVPLVTEMCDYLNGNWTAQSAIQLAAYALWKLNWIHPFFGGNGRTARAFSYLVLSIRLGFSPTGGKTIPEYIVENRDAYYKALRTADRGAKNGGEPDLTEMEALLESLLAKQLLAVHSQACGRSEG